MKEQQLLPTKPFPQQEYPSYFSLFQNKPALLSQIYKENMNLGNATRRLITEGIVTGIKVRTTTGKKDILVRLNPNPKK
jgi:hypothetical protein